MIPRFGSTLSSYKNHTSRWSFLSSSLLSLTSLPVYVLFFSSPLSLGFPPVYMMSRWPTNKHWPRSWPGREDTEQQGRTARLLYNFPHDPSATPTHGTLTGSETIAALKCSAEEKQQQRDGEDAACKPVNSAKFKSR